MTQLIIKWVLSLSMRDGIPVNESLSRLFLLPEQRSQMITHSILRVPLNVENGDSFLHWL